MCEDTELPEGCEVTTEITRRNSVLIALLAEWRGKGDRPPIDEAFKKFTKRKFKDARFTIDCVKGNFSVSGPDMDDVYNEARHYFRLYHEDGEYDS